MPLLEVCDIEGGYGEYRVLEGVSLSVGEGEVVALLGPNGHGKTTLLRMISGLIRPARGVIKFRGRPIHAVPPAEIAGMGISHIPQGDLLLPQMLVRENILAGLYLRWSERKERLQRILEDFPQLKARQNVPARVLSGGERRMLALARGLVGGPLLLIVDEPSLGLAPSVRDSVYAMLRKSAAEGLSILLVEERVSHLEGLADRVYIMESGRIALHGPAETILRDSQQLLRAYMG